MAPETGFPMIVDVFEDLCRKAAGLVLAGACAAGFSVIGVVAAVVQPWAISDAAAAGAVAGRVFTLAALTDTSRRLAVEEDGTVWVADRRFGPGDSQPRRVIRQRGVVDLAALRGGGIVFSQTRASGGVVWLRTADGSVDVVAGRLTATETGPPAADGADATEVPLCGVGAVAGLPDGGFVFVDRETTVRRVTADGTMTTMYVVPGADPVFGCPEHADHPTEFIGDLAVAPDGALILATDSSSPPDEPNRLVRISPTGERRLLLVTGNGVPSVAAAPDGSVIVAGDLPPSIRRLDVRTRRSTPVLPATDTLEKLGRAPSVFDLDGMRSTSYLDKQFVGVAVGADGGIWTTSNPLSGSVPRAPRLHYVAPQRPSRLAVAMESRTGRAATAGYTTRLRLTRAARLSVRVMTARGGIAYRAERRARPGRSVLRLGHRFRPGLYDVNITARAAGERARDAVRVYLGGRLSVNVARTALVPPSIDSCKALGAGAADEDPCLGHPLPIRDDGCRGYGPTRVDCRYSYRALRSVPRRCYHVAGVLRRDGTVELFELATPQSPIASCAPQGLPQRPEWIPRDEEPTTVLPEQH